MVSNLLSISIGEKIRKRRIELGYTQEFMSMRLNTTQNSISNIEKGKTGITLEKLIEVTTILKVDLNYFIEVQDNIDQKEIRIKKLEELVKRLEKRNEILELYIVKLLQPNQKNELNE